MLLFKPKILYVRNQKTKKFVPILAIRGAKGPPGTIDNISDYLTSETGDSEDLAMSQKGVTLLLADVESDLESIGRELEEIKLSFDEVATKTALKETNSALTEAKAELTNIKNTLEFIYGNGTLGLKFEIEGTTCYVAGIGYAINNTKIVIPSKIYNIPVTAIGNNAFSNCTFTSIVIPDSIKRIGNSAFSGCNSLTSVSIPNSVLAIDNYAFFGCTSLVAITLPDSVRSLGAYVFSGCSNLTRIIIPKSAYSIPTFAFSGCTNLASITIPISVTSIDSNAFSNCDNLKDIYYSGSESDWAAIDIDANNLSVINAATIHFNSET